MFDLHGIERLAAWKSCRDHLEICDRPLDFCAEFWARAPFVNQYLDPYDPASWPDPWRLILDSKFDDLAISLGMLYTLKLTDRFMKSRLEIHMITSGDPKRKNHFLIVDDTSVLNLKYGSVENRNTILDLPANKIYP